MSEPWKDYAPAASSEGPWTDYARPARQKPKSEALGFYKGLMKPLDNMAMATEAAARGVGIDTGAVNELLRLPSAAQATQQHENAIARSPSRPAAIGEVAGNIIGTLPAVIATKNPMIGGAMQGAMLTDKRSLEGVAADAGIGGVLGHVGGKVVDAAADLIKPVIEPAVQRLSAAGVKLTPGMVKGGKAMAREDKRMSRPLVGDAIAESRQATQDTFNIAGLNDALAPIGAKVPSPMKPGHEAVDWAHRQVSAAYDQVIPHIAVRLNGQQFAQNLMPAVQSLPAAQRREFQRLLNTHLGNGQLAGQALKDAQGELRRLATKYVRGQSVAEQELGDALWAADHELTGAMIAQNPKFAPQLQATNKAFRGLAIIEDAASRADGGVINTGQLKQSVRRADQSRRKSATARGQAFMQDFSEDARKVIPARVPNSGTADRTQAASLFAKLGGAADLGAYRVDEMIQQLRLLPRPQQAAAMAALMRRLQMPAAAGTVAIANQSGN